MPGQGDQCLFRCCQRVVVYALRQNFADFFNRRSNLRGSLSFDVHAIPFLNQAADLSLFRFIDETTNKNSCHC
jgi:hypothetical protein